MPHSVIKKQIFEISSKGLATLEYKSHAEMSKLSVCMMNADERCLCCLSLRMENTAAVNIRDCECYRPAQAQAHLLHSSKYPGFEVFGVFILLQFSTVVLCLCLFLQDLPFHCSCYTGTWSRSRRTTCASLPATSPSPGDLASLISSCQVREKCFQHRHAKTIPFLANVDLSFH